MKFGIIAALDEEIRLIKEQMKNPRQTKITGLTYFEGEIYRKKVVAVCCSVGKVNAAICATLLLDHFAADCVINIGIAGAVGEGMQVMDVVLSKRAGYHDTDPVMEKYFPKRMSFWADEKLLSLAEAVSREQGVRYHVGGIATGDVFVQEQTVKKQIVDKCQPHCVEMEGAAIAHAAFTFDKPFLIIRSMSDSADESAEQTYDNFMAKAAAQSAKIVLGMIQEGNL